MKLFDFTKAASVIALTTQLGATEASAQEPNIIVGSLQNNGGVCFQMRKIRIEDNGNIQPAGTARLCSDANGVFTGMDETAIYDPNVICVVPNKENQKIKKEVPCPIVFGQK